MSFILWTIMMVFTSSQFGFAGVGPSTAGHELDEELHNHIYFIKLKEICIDSNRETWWDSAEVKPFVSFDITKIDYEAENSIDKVWLPLIKYRGENLSDDFGVSYMSIKAKSCSPAPSARSVYIPTDSIVGQKVNYTVRLIEDDSNSEDDIIKKDFPVTLNLRALSFKNDNLEKNNKVALHKINYGEGSESNENMTFEIIRMAKSEDSSEVEILAIQENLLLKEQVEALTDIVQRTTEKAERTNPLTEFYRINGEMMRLKMQQDQLRFQLQLMNGIFNN